MYFSTLKRRIQSLDEKSFYDIAIFFLECSGYKDLSIVDGTGDGGRDVICSRSDLRIQLSIRKDWATKINDEAKKTQVAGRRHFIYVTNRPIREKEKTEFITDNYKYKGEVDLSIFDLNRISTALARPGAMKQAYSMLGITVDSKLTASVTDIALSNLLLFSSEAKEFKDEIIESVVKSIIYKEKKINQNLLIEKAIPLVPGLNSEQYIRQALGRLSASGKIKNTHSEVSLCAEEILSMSAAEQEHIQSTQADFDLLQSKYGLSPDNSRKIIDCALEVLARSQSFDGDEISATTLSDLISNANLGKKREELYEDLSKLSVFRVSQFGNAINHISSTNTFDIYRALGRNTEITLVLDSSVAMPLMFGREFYNAKSRYGVAASALNTLCDDHNIKIVIPRCYLNEIASHGQKAADFLDTYNALSDDIRSVLKSSGNAYLSHYSHIRSSLDSEGDSLTLEEFLNHFGIRRGSSKTHIENKIETILDRLGINVVSGITPDPSIKSEIRKRKPYDHDIIIEHDAIVCTWLKSDSNSGYVFATWDKIITEFVEGLSRIYADTPARIVDFLSMATGSHYESEQSFDLLSALIYCDEKKMLPVAQKIEKIKSTSQAHKVNALIDEIKNKHRDNDVIYSNDVSEFFSEINIESQVLNENQNPTS